MGKGEVDENVSLVSASERFTMQVRQQPCEVTHDKQNLFTNVKYIVVPAKTLMRLRGVPALSVVGSDRLLQHQVFGEPTRCSGITRIQHLSTSCSR
jgi:hypothetical protein